MNHPPAARHINPWHFSPTPCLVLRLLLTPQSSHLSVTSVCPLPSDAAWLSPRSFRITPTIAWFISYTQGTWVMLSPLSILSSPLPFLTYSHFQHCHFFWPCWPCEVEAVLGIETWAESYNVAETNPTSQDSAIHWWGAELLHSLLQTSGPNLFGTRDQFRGSQFFYRWWWVRAGGTVSGWFKCITFIVQFIPIITSVQQTLNPGGWGPLL